ncbi:MAG: tetratricopeptide repeat protein [Anaerolineae bacterium]
MDCPRCGDPIEANSAFCSNCGLKFDQSTRALGSADSASEMEDTVAPDKKQGCRTALMIAGIALLVVVIVGLLGAGAVYLGLRDRESVQVRQAQGYFEQAEAYMSQGDYELAIAAYDQALALDPGHATAAARREEANRLLAGAPTGTPALREETIEALWQEHQQSVERANWAEMVVTAERIIAQDPTYRRAELDQNLYSAFLGLGNQAVADDRLEEALRYLDRALAIRPNAAEAIRLQNLIRLYMDGLRFYGADWPNAVDRLATLYSTEPDFRDVGARLRSAYISYGEQLEGDELWCEAAAQYRLAQQLAADGELDAQAQNATDRCSAIGPGGAGTPGAATDVPSGTYAGREIQPEAVGADKMFIRGHVSDSSGAPVAGTRVKIQAWDFSVFATTDSTGQFSFDGLANPVKYTLTLADLASVPLEVETAWGRLSWVVFEQAK